MSVSCSNCDFYVSDDAKFCPNCGISSPSETYISDNPNSFRDSVTTLAFIIGIVIAVAVAYLRSDGKFNNTNEFFIILLLGLAVGFLISTFVSTFVLSRMSSKERRARFADINEAETLRGINESAILRKIELEDKLAEIEDYLAEKPEDFHSEFLDLMRVKILDSINRSDFCQTKIRFAYLQNDFLPFVENDDFRSQDFVDLIDQADEKLADILDLLKEIEFSENSAYLAEEKELMTKEVSDFRNICKNFQTTESTENAIERQTLNLEQFSQTPKFLARLSKSSKEDERIFESLKINFAAVEDYLER